MDPICEEKINYLQKYVPFLANLIGLLANDRENEGKLEQMQLLFDLLKKPDNSVTLTTLEKCEEVLSRVFGNADDKQDGGTMEKSDGEEEVEGEEPVNNEPEAVPVGEQAAEESPSAVNGLIEEKFNAPEDNQSRDGNVIEDNHPNQGEEQNPEDGSEIASVTFKTNDNAFNGNEADSNPESTGQKTHLDDQQDDIESREQDSPLAVSIKEECSEIDLPSVEIEQSTEQGEPCILPDCPEEGKSLKSDSSESNTAKCALKEKTSGKVVATMSIDAEADFVERGKAEIGEVDKNGKATETDEATEMETGEPAEIEADELAEAKRIEAEVCESVSSGVATVVPGETVEVLSGEAAKIATTELISGDTTEPISLDTTQESEPYGALGNDMDKATETIPDEPTGLASESISEGPDTVFDKQPETGPQEAQEQTPDERPEKALNETAEPASDETPRKPIDDGASSGADVLSEEEPARQFDETPEASSEKVTEKSFDEDHDECDDIIRQNPGDMLPFKIISAESLAIQSVHSLAEDTFTAETGSQPNDTAKDQTIDESNRDRDPLAMLDHSNEKSLPIIPKTVPTENNVHQLHTTIANERVNDDDDDVDDVLLIETRSSPICIDSDPEDSEEHKKHNISLPPLPAINSSLLAASLQAPRASARKSTSAIVQRSHLSVSQMSNHRKPNSSRDRGYLLKKDPKILMETISLIDTDSDDEKPTQPPPQSNKTRTDDDVIIVSSTQPQRRSNSSKKPNSVPQPKIMTRTSTKSTTRPPTAQSNFLNAVNLQPAPKLTPKSDSNPAAFSAQLSNKKLIIPNAFYGNPPPNRKLPSSSSAIISQDESSSNDSIPRNSHSAPTTSISQVQDRMLKEWLENFLANFASPQQLASHACFVLLQRVLKYRFFQRLKEIRLILNTHAKNSRTETVDSQVLLDLRYVFLKSGQLTEAGRKFCRFATNDAFGKPVALTTDYRTGKVTCRTRIGSEVDTQANTVKATKPNVQDKSSALLQSPSAIPRVSPSNSTITSPNPPSTTPSASSSSSSLSSLKRNRKGRKQSDGTIAGDGDNNDNDYTPYMGELVLEDEIVSERKKSLRTNRTRRKEAGFTYSEDHDDEEFEALAKKIEDKKREELRLAEEREERERERELEREKKAKKTVAKKTTSKRPISQPQLGPLTPAGEFSHRKHESQTMLSPLEAPREPTRKRLRLDQSEIIGNADDDLLTPTWIEADGDDCDDAEVDSLPDFAGEPHSPENGHPPADGDNDTLTEPGDDSDDNANAEIFDIGTNKSLKNTDRRLHARGLHFDFCVHCLRRVPRIVHHYVNEHRLSEVFTSRLRTKDIRRLLTTSNVGFVHLYKGNQQQYAAHCIFCDKGVKFLLPYWFEHFTMHTGEYGFKCSGCNIRKPTRSLLTNHLQSGSGCPKKGTAVRLYTFDTKSSQIEAHICVLCNYVQLHRKNIIRHLRAQHNIAEIKAKHIIKVVLLQISGPYPDEESLAKDASQLTLLQSEEDEQQTDNAEDDANDEEASADNTAHTTQSDYNDDLSFAICGMLDVETNVSAPGGKRSKSKTSNHVDN